MDAAGPSVFQASNLDDASGSDDKRPRCVGAGGALRPAILVDVNGLLNPYAAKPERRPEGYATHRFRPRGSVWERGKHPLRVWLRAEHGAWLRDLAAQTGAELVWATTWADEANRLIAPVLGLPGLPVIDIDSYGNTHREGRHGKIPAVAEWAARRPIAWFDEFQPGDPAWAVQRSADGAATLLVPVDPRTGIQPHHIVQVLRFLNTAR